MRHVISVQYKGIDYEFPVTSRLRSRFFSKFKKGRPNECWEWQGARHPRGYGAFGIFLGVIGGKPVNMSIPAHRISWEIVKGPLNGLECLHSCDNPPCVNSGHLFKGTQLDNIRDAIAKGRFHDFRSITFAQAEEIRRVYVPYSRRFGCHALGRQYGICFQAVSLIVAGRLYKRSWNSTVTPS